MKTINLNIAIRHCQLDELTVADRELIEQAMKATDNAYAEYSHFYVGAALRLADGRIVIGANQENAAFPSGLCAERTAVFSAQANFPDQSIDTLALVARNDNGLTDNPLRRVEPVVRCCLAWKNAMAYQCVYLCTAKAECIALVRRKIYCHCRLSIQV